MTTLDKLLSGLDARIELGSPPAPPISDITEDSRAVTPGAFFVARAGARHDGVALIEDAARKGASAVLLLRDDLPRAPRPAGVAVASTPDLARVTAQAAERFFGAPSSNLLLVGVTGTNGKTTVAHFVQRLLNALGAPCGLLGTVRTDVGDAPTASSLTTPQAIDLSRALAVAVRSGKRAVAMEVSSHALAQGRVSAVSFDIGVYTNLSGDHMDFHRSMEEYADAKGGLFGMLPGGGVGVRNIDDAWCARVTGRCAARMIDCTMTGDAACRAEVLSATRTHTRVRLSGAWGSIEAGLPLVGAHNVMNTLEAAAAAWAALERLSISAPAAALAGALEQLEAPPGRLEPVRLPSGAAPPFTVLVDYAHTDHALENAIRAVRPLVGEGGALRVVFGCGGDRDRTKRPRMARTAATLADAVYVTSDNPRTERPEAIISETLSGVPAALRSRLCADADRAGAIRLAIRDAGEGDVVLIAGKGHEDYQLLPDERGGIVRRRFDDREEARAALAERFEPDHSPASTRSVRAGAA